MRREYNNPKVVAVTGGIGSGQTTVCTLFKKWGAKVINADEKAKEVIRKNRGLQAELKKVFGNSIFSGRNELNRKRLAELAFRDEISTQRLNQLVHPRMVESLVEEMEQARFSKKYPLIVIDAALVFEISIEQMFDAVVVVNAPLNARMQRVKQRDQMTREQFESRNGKQIPLAEKCKWADYVIQNDGTMEELERRTREVFNQLLNRGKRQGSKK